MKNIYEYLLSKNYRQVHYPENSPLYPSVNESSTIASLAIWSLIAMQFFVSSGGWSSLIFFTFLMGGFAMQKNITQSRKKFWGSEYVNWKITREVWGNDNALRNWIESLMRDEQSPEQFRSSGKYLDLLKFYAQKEKNKFHEELHSILLEYWLEVRGESKLKSVLKEKSEPGFINNVVNYFTFSFDFPSNGGYSAIQGWRQRVKNKIQDRLEGHPHSMEYMGRAYKEEQDKEGREDREGLIKQKKQIEQEIESLENIEKNKSLQKRYLYHK